METYREEIEMSEKTVGEFTYRDGSILGPAAFMRSTEWTRTKARIESGTDVVLGMCLEQAPDATTGLLVFVQTCYAGWHGMETFNRTREAAWARDEREHEGRVS